MSDYSHLHAISGNLGSSFFSEHMQLEGVGRLVCVPATRYYYNGLDRPEKNHALFQYTMAGTGSIRIGNEHAKLLPGQAFMVGIPGDHEYFLDPRDKEWDFYYLMLRGDWGLCLLEQIIENTGNIISIDEHSMPIRLLKDIHGHARTHNVGDCCRASLMAYQFLMELYRFSFDVMMEKYPPLVRQAIDIIQDEYATLDGIKILAARLQVSEAHLIRTFTRYVGIPPGKYLHNTRLEHAVWLLQNTFDTLDEIAVKVGFTGGNYLGKLLRQRLDGPTLKYRTLRGSPALR